MKKTKFASYFIKGIAEGCKYCVRGEKLVLFITGICRTNCYYCSLSRKRKNIDKIWVNERNCKNIRDLIEEVKESNATSAGITGGNPLLVLNRTLSYIKALKNKFGKNFHIHIYLPTRCITAEKLSKLAIYVDEVRFHPEFLARKLTKKEAEEEINKIRLAGLFWNKPDIGIELPLLPGKKKETLSFIKKIASYIGFVNLNELEISDTNFNYLIKNYKLKEGGYVVSKSKESGIDILRKLKNTNLKIHLCTAETKNWFQYRNRLRKHRILPYGFKTKDGTVVYLAIYSENNKEFKKLQKQIKEFKKIYIDKKKKRIIISEKLVPKLKNYRMARVEEFPTFDATEIQFEYI